MNVKVLSPTGESKSEVTLDDAIFAAKINVSLMHQIVTAQLAAARAGTHSTKTRGEVRGGGSKPWRQKGTGRARHGSTREPQWKGGGIVFGPKPRDHSQSVPKKMKAAALRSALSDRARDGNVLVVDGLSFDKPKTKEAVAALKAWGAEGKVLLVLTLEDTNTAFAFRNLPKVHVISDDQLNVYDVMNADKVVFAKGALDALQSRIGSSKDEPTEPAAAAPATPATTPEAKAEEPKAEEPKAEAPKAEEPKAEEPKAEEPPATTAQPADGEGESS